MNVRVPTISKSIQFLYRPWTTAILFGLGFRTGAVVFGRKRTFIASLCMFTAAYLLLVYLSEVGVLPRLLLWTTTLWPFHMAWSLVALKQGLRFETAVWMQRRYRLLFGVIALVMLIR